MSTGQITKFSKGKGYESIPRELLQDSNLSLEAIGLLCYMQSLPENWKLYKTQLYTQFPKNKRSVIDRIWKELINNKYLLSFKKREGKKYNYNYIFSVIPLTEEDINDITNQQNDNDFWSVDFQQSNLNSSKSTTNKLTIKKSTKKNDDDNNINKMTKPESKKIPNIQLNSELEFLAKELLYSQIDENETFKILEYFDLNKIAIKPEIIQQQIQWMSEKINIGTGISSYSSYFINGCLKRLRNIDNTPPIDMVEVLPEVPMFNWLEN